MVVKSSGLLLQLALVLTLLLRSVSSSSSTEGPPPFFLRGRGAVINILPERVDGDFPVKEWYDDTSPAAVVTAAAIIENDEEANQEARRLKGGKSKGGGGGMGPVFALTAVLGVAQRMYKKGKDGQIVPRYDTRFAGWVPATRGGGGNHHGSGIFGGGGGGGRMDGAAKIFSRSNIDDEVTRMRSGRIPSGPTTAWEDEESGPASLRQKYARHVSPAEEEGGGPRSARRTPRSARSEGGGGFWSARSSGGNSSWSSNCSRPSSVGSAARQTAKSFWTQKGAEGLPAGTLLKTTLRTPRGTRRSVSGQVVAWNRGTGGATDGGFRGAVSSSKIRFQRSRRATF